MFTFPVSPSPGVSLFGYLVACDRSNRVPLGSTASYMLARRRHTSAYFADGGTYASGAALDLDHLAEANGITRAAVGELTFAPDLERLFNRPAVSIKKLGTPTTAICVACWPGDAPHLRAHLLPGVTGCVEHELALRTTCDCGERVSLHPMDVGACSRCGRRWDALRALPLQDEALERHRQLLGIYDYLLLLPGVNGAKERLRWLRDERRLAGLGTLPLQLRTASIAHLAALFIALEADPDLIHALVAPSPDPCPNATCPNFAADVGGTQARHCSICGTRFVGNRIIVTFDLGHGHDHPTDDHVRAAQARVSAWRLALRAACTRLARLDRPITIEAAFVEAGVPWNAYLRATRVGLTAIVRSAEARRRKEAGTWGYVLQGRVRAAAARGDWPWLFRWLRDDVRHPAVPEVLLPPPHPRLWHDYLVWE